MQVFKKLRIILSVALMLIPAVLFAGDDTLTIKKANSRFLYKPAGFLIVFPSQKEIDSWFSGSIYEFDEFKDNNSRLKHAKILAGGLDKYPPEILKKTIHIIYVCGNIGSRDKTYSVCGSTEPFHSGGHDIYLSIEENTLNIEGVLHHEYSHILMREYGSLFNKDKWMKLVPGEYPFILWTSSQGNKNDPAEFDAGAECIGSVCLDKTDERTGKGFLIMNSQMDILEDMADYSAFLMLGSRHLSQLSETNELIRSKISLIIDFYSRIDPVYKESYFKKMVKIKNVAIQASGKDRFPHPLSDNAWR